MKYIFMDFPIASIHPHAPKAHEAANCAEDQGRYWEMHDRLFQHQNTLDLKGLSGHAAAIGLDVGVFDRCLHSGKYEQEIRRDLAQGVEAGIRGTPTFLLGFTESGKTEVKALEIIRGAQPYATFKQLIDKLLAKKPGS